MKNRYRLYFYPFLFILLITALFFKSNAPKIYEIYGNHCYNTNNIEKALDFYERALNLDKDNYLLKDKYLNILINSPLTVKTQEKLVQIAENEKDDYTSTDAERFLYKLKYKIHEKYPYNYILQAPYNQKILHWGKLPITYGFKQDIPEREIIEGIKEAFDEWENVSNLKFQMVNKNPDIIIDFIQNDSQGLENGNNYVIAYTTPIVNDNLLQNMVIKFNIRDLDGNIYTKNQIYNTALHEIFHALGFMGHSYNKNNIMHMSKDKYLAQKDAKQVLTEADITTLELLYKTKPDITNSDELEYEYVPYLVLGNYFKSKEAKNYIKKAPDLPNGYLDYAETLVTEKKYDKAEESLNRALTLADNDDTKYIIYYDLAVVNYYKEKFSEAGEYLNLAKQIRTDDEAQFLEAEIAVKQNDYEKAIKNYQYLIQKHPENINFSVNLANIYIKRKDYLNARKVIKTFIINNPKEKDNPMLSGYGILKI